ncbi:hypothetical protein ACKC9G_12445 [Pokkaliibacter sp. CJK22405]|uniref:hypothetical protein n=1 Tax=Pokkaliibacter sp. CJK22405 TaxID=3384615 RepID=UPI0039846B13
MPVTLGQTYNHYLANGHSSASNGNASPTKTASQAVVHNVNASTMDKLQLSSAVAKTIGTLCDRSNQLDHIYMTNGDSNFRSATIRRYDLSGDMMRNHVFSGACDEMRDFSEHVLSAVMNQRRDYNRSHSSASRLPTHAVTVGELTDVHGFAMLGDPREKPASQVAVVDGWVMNPSAVTLDNYLFSGSLSVSSSTTQEPSRYLNKVVEKYSLSQLEETHYGRSRSSKERDNWREQLKDHIAAGNVEIWDTRYSDRTPDKLAFYKTGDQGAVSFDYLPRQEIEQKNALHAQAVASSWGRLTGAGS